MVMLFTETLLPQYSNLWTLLYHSAIRFITGASYNTHHCALYDLVGWPSLALRRDIHWYLFIFKTLIGKHPPYLTQLLSWNTGSYQTRSSDLLLLKVPRAQSRLAKCSFSFNAPYSWNALQRTLKMDSMPSLVNFKSVIMQYCTSVCNCLS